MIAIEPRELKFLFRYLFCSLSTLLSSKTAHCHNAWLQSHKTHGRKLDLSCTLLDTLVLAVEIY